MIRAQPWFRGDIAEISCINEAISLAIVCKAGTVKY